MASPKRTCACTYALAGALAVLIASLCAYCIMEADRRRRESYQDFLFLAAGSPYAMKMSTDRPLPSLKMPKFNLPKMKNPFAQL